MVFDSYDNPDAFLIQDFIPHGDAGAILVTSRHAGTSELVSEHSSSFIELPGLEEKDALKLLFLASQVEVSSTNTAVGEDIVWKLGQHPLAITQAGSYIMKRKLPLHEFLNEYKRRKDIVLKTTPQLSQYRRKLGDEEKETLLNVFTTWELSFEQLQLQTSKDSTEIKLLTLFAFFDNSDISERLFSKRGRIEIRFPETLKLVAWLENFTDHNHGWDGGMFRDTLIVLRDLSLLQTFTKEKDGFCHSSMHPLVKDWIRIRTERSICQENSQIATILIESVLCNAYDEKTEDFKLQRSIKENLTKHIIAQIENYEDYLAFSMTLLSNYLFAQVDLIIFLQRMGFHKHARIMGEQAVKKCTEILGLEDVITMRGMHALGTVFFQHEQYDEAVKLYVQVVDFYKTLVGVEHRTTLRSMQNLSTAYSRLGQLKQAEEIQVQIVKNCQVARGPEDFSTLVSTRELARTYWRQGRVEEAEELQSSTLDTSTRTMGLEHQVTISLMHNLACTYHQQGRTSEAIELMKRAVDLRTKILSPSHPDTLEAVKILNEWRGT